MLNKDVQIGETYKATVSGNRVKVRVLREHDRKGWWVLNLTTNREVQVKTGGRLTPLKVVDIEKERAAIAAWDIVKLAAYWNILNFPAFKVDDGKIERHTGLVSEELTKRGITHERGKRLTVTPVS